MFDAGKGVAKDYAIAAKWFKAAADQGDVKSHYNLASMYKHGDGVPQDYAEAARLYRMAAEGGHVKALNNLASLYLSGKGVAADPSMAANLFFKAATQGHPSAQFNLGLMYRDGNGVTKDLVKSHMWLNIARENGVGKASEKMAAIEGAMSQADISAAVEKAKSCFQSKYQTCQ